MRTCVPQHTGAFISKGLRLGQGQGQGHRHRNHHQHQHELALCISPVFSLAAVDALVAAGFKASGDELDWLATEVKKRVGPVEPATAAKKQRPRGLAKELAGLGRGEDEPVDEMRGGAARRVAREARAR